MCPPLFRQPIADDQGDQVDIFALPAGPSAKSPQPCVTVHTLYGLPNAGWVSCLLSAHWQQYARLDAGLCGGDPEADPDVQIWECIFGLTR